MDRPKENPRGSGTGPIVSAAVGGICAVFAILLGFFSLLLIVVPGDSGTDGPPRAALGLGVVFPIAFFFALVAWRAVDTRRDELYSIHGWRAIATINLILAFIGLSAWGALRGALPACIAGVIVFFREPRLEPLRRRLISLLGF